ncbi:MAG TPA: hypothetical protein VF456_25625 [Vicinamibacterales bacterium]
MKNAFHLCLTVRPDHGSAGDAGRPAMFSFNFVAFVGFVAS